jgi:hypothetical protein
MIYQLSFIIHFNFDLLYQKTFLTKLHIKTGFLSSMGYQKSEKVTLGNYIDKVEVVREVNRQGFSYFG